MNPAIDSVRSRVLIETGFDLYASPRFIEHLICSECNLKPTTHTSPHDALHADGFKIEIKSSILADKVVRATSTSGRKHVYNRSRFYFDCLQGVGGKGKGVHVYVLVGIHEGQLSFFVIPNSALKGKKTVEIFPDERVYRNSEKWLNYEVSFEDLEAAIRRAGSGGETAQLQIWKA